MKVQINTERFFEYTKYHYDSCVIWDDPSFPWLNYVSEKRKYKLEQKYRLAFLYSTCYCCPTAIYMIETLPDLKEINTSILNDWWKQNKQKCLFQTDKKRIKNNNQFVELVMSYKYFIGQNTQKERFEKLKGKDEKESYDKIFEAVKTIKHMWRFWAFLYLEALQSLTNVWIEPTWLDLKEALSSCNWLAYAVGRDDLVVRRQEKRHLTDEQYEYLNECLKEIVEYIQKYMPETHSTIWNIETTLCAYKKRKRWKRYVGYYIDRMWRDIKKMEEMSWYNFNDLWEFRAKSIPHEYLEEFNS